MQPERRIITYKIGRRTDRFLRRAHPAELTAQVVQEYAHGLKSTSVAVGSALMGEARIHLSQLCLKC